MDPNFLPLSTPLCPTSKCHTACPLTMSDVQMTASLLYKHLATDMTIRTKTTRAVTKPMSCSFKHEEEQQGPPKYMMITK